jgi:uncharacterized membrane protein YfcA
VSLWEAVAVTLAGLAAGTINAVVGSGTLVTFPVLLAVGYPPVLANVTNTVGLVPGSLSGAVGYRRELVAQGRRVARLAVASVLGGITGAVLLLVLPEDAFQAIVPVLIGLACVMVVAQPRVAARLRAREDHEPRHHAGPLLYGGIYLAGIYGRRIPQPVLRGLVVLVGLVAMVQILTG